MEEAVEFGNYLPLSYKNPEICLGFDLAALGNPPEIETIRHFHQALTPEYGSCEHGTL